MEANGDREEVHPHRKNGGQEKSSSNLHMKDSQSTQKNIEMKFREFLEKVQAPLNEIAASNVLRGVPSDNLVCVIFLLLFLLFLFLFPMIFTL